MDTSREPSKSEQLEELYKRVAEEEPPSDSQDGLTFRDPLFAPAGRRKLRQLAQAFDRGGPKAYEAEFDRIFPEKPSDSEK